MYISRHTIHTSYCALAVLRVPVNYSELIDAKSQSLMMRVNCMGEVPT